MFVNKFSYIIENIDVNYKKSYYDILGDIIRNVIETKPHLKSNIENFIFLLFD